MDYLILKKNYECKSMVLVSVDLSGGGNNRLNQVSLPLDSIGGVTKK